MCKYRDYSISLKAVTAIPAFINFIVSKPMALPYVIWAGHLHGLDHGIILSLKITKLSYILSNTLIMRSKIQKEKKIKKKSREQQN